jgi:hypothetical protein
MDAHLNEHRIALKNAGPARKVPAIDWINREKWNFVNGKEGTDASANEHRVGLRTPRPESQKLLISSRWAVEIWWMKRKPISINIRSNRAKSGSVERFYDILIESFVYTD